MDFWWSSELATLQACLFLGLQVYGFPLLGYNIHGIQISSKPHYGSKGSWVIASRHRKISHRPKSNISPSLCTHFTFAIKQNKHTDRRALLSPSSVYVSGKHGRACVSQTSPLNLGWIKSEREGSQRRKGVFIIFWPLTVAQSDQRLHGLTAMEHHPQAVGQNKSTSKKTNKSFSLRLLL